MLTVKLANKEKETELLRCKQDVADHEFAKHEHTLRQQQEEHAQVTAELTAMNQELQRQVQLLQIQCDRLQGEGETQRTVAHEQRRLRDKEQTQARFDSRQFQQAMDELRHELRQSLRERQTLESKWQEALEQQQTQNSLVRTPFHTHSLAAWPDNPPM
ncbi:hypothetical protein BBJ28_00010694 [Nothophytophthora sp. Chile5]|nr:hypothetical protein BBJ28_00010694 [Nothophytophthora sp. Chile5]